MWKLWIEIKVNLHWVLSKISTGQFSEDQRWKFLNLSCDLLAFQQKSFHSSTNQNRLETSTLTFLINVSITPPTNICFYKSFSLISDNNIHCLTHIAHRKMIRHLTRVKSISNFILRWTLWILNSSSASAIDFGNRTAWRVGSPRQPDGAKSMNKNCW